VERGVAILELDSKAEICQFDNGIVPLGRQKYVLWLYISVNHISFV
jgi:hypothetical protein